MLILHRREKSKVYFLLAVSSNHGLLSLRKPGEGSLRARANHQILSMICATDSSLAKALMESLHRSVIIVVSVIIIAI